MTLKQIVYASVPMPRISEEVLRGIGNASSQKNAANGVSGTLFFNGTSIVQLIEGPESEIDGLFDKIKADCRHHSIGLLLERTIESRHFPEWPMKYIRSYEEEDLSVLIDEISEDPDSGLRLMAKLAKAAIPETETEEDVKPTILVVDDDRFSLRMLARFLKKKYRVEEALSGEAAQELLSEITPDLILLDVDIPKMNGFEICSQLKQKEATREIPVIFLSSKDEIRHKVKGLAIGASDYVTKPYQPDELLARISTHIEIASLRNDLKKSMEEMTEKNRRLDMFAKSLAHDLRNPLGAIIGGSSLLAMEVDDAELSPIVAMIENAGKNLSETVDSLLLLAVADHQKVNMCSVNPVRVAELCVRDLEAMVNQYQGDFEIEQGMIACQAHEPWLRRVFTNLFSNALKYGGKPPVVRLTSKMVDAETVRYSVVDNGEGLSDEQVTRLFNEFTRLSPEVAPGIGLGLVLVKSLVNQMRGTIQVKSERGVGSTFYIDLPLAISPESSCPELVDIGLVS